MRFLLPALLPGLLTAPATRPARTFTLVYRAAPEKIPVKARRVRLWIPVPSTTRDQRVAGVRVTLFRGKTSLAVPLRDLAKVREVGGKPVACEVHPIRHGRGRSLCVTALGAACAVELSCRVTRFESRGGGRAGAREIQAALQADRLVPLGKKVSGIAKTLPDQGDPLATARLLYNHTLKRMRYRKPAGGPWGRGDSEWACDSRYGNCSDFHSYFMALARTKGIPTRFEIGLPVPAGDKAEARIGGYHCWAFFYAGDRRGWVPVDISEAEKHPGKADYYFGTLDCDRVTLTGGRDLELTPRPAAGPLNFFALPHVEVDGRVWPHVTTSFLRR